MSKQEDTENTARAANTRGEKVRRKRRRTEPDDVKMHIRMPRNIHAECTNEADRQGISINQIVVERVVAGSTERPRAELTQLIADVATFGNTVLQFALDALWATDEISRMRCIRDALHAARNAAG